MLNGFTPNRNRCNWDQNLPLPDLYQLLPLRTDFRRDKQKALLTPQTVILILFLWNLSTKPNTLTFHSKNFPSFSPSSPSFSALSLPSIFSLSGLSHTCSWQLGNRGLWCCKGYFISGDSHQFIHYCAGYSRTQSERWLCLVRSEQFANLSEEQVPIKGL